ncbi:MAG: sigma-70 family RNA polymerase sigma factor [Muribaculaceae bacterium]
MKTEQVGSLNEMDARFIAGLKSGDSAVCREFFYNEIVGVLQKVRIQVFRGLVDFDEMVSELYLYLSRNGWSKLDGFDGQNGCRLRSWMIPVAWRFFVDAYDRLMHVVADDADAEKMAYADVSDDLRIQVAIDVNAVLERMPNERYAEVLRLLLVDGYDAQDVAAMMGVKVENVYNLKHRAIRQFIEMYGR